MAPHSEDIELLNNQVEILFSRMTGSSDPRVSSCLYCRSCVVATEPFSELIDVLNVEYNDTDLYSRVIDMIENTDSVHLYIWEDNDCLHNLWRDPLASEWSDITGEKRL